MDNAMNEIEMHDGLAARMMVIGTLMMLAADASKAQVQWCVYRLPFCTALDLDEQPEM